MFFLNSISLVLLTFLIQACIFIHVQDENINLEGDWQLKNENGSFQLKADVPGYVHSALLKAGYIGDPYFRYNDELYRWIDYDNWTYSRLFHVQKTLWNKTNIVLICEGLDTIANVTINGILIGHSTNMFQKYVWDIKKSLVPGINHIMIAFTSPVTYSANKSKHYSYLIPPACPPPVQHGECHINLIRKKQCSFAWDWGPAFASQGIWKNISIHAFDSATLEHVLIKTVKGSKTSKSWNLTIDALIECGTTKSSGVVLATMLELGAASKLTINCVSTGQFIFTLPIMVLDDIETWWPSGYGKQPLYNLAVTFKSDGSSDISEKSLRIGFREVELVQEAITGGLSFFYKVNNVPIFIKGANWIPADSFEDRVSDEIIRNLLQSAVDANMNIVRNWGGGIYQHDAFYNIADELGLLIWQEFMFACDYYPADEEILDSVEQEIEYQMQRLQYHPSIIVWSGNNEVEQSISQNWYNLKNLSVYKEDYIKLFINTVRKTALRVDSSRPFVSSSPSNGLNSEKEGWISKDPNSEFYGDVHYYNYTMDCLDIRGYPQPRFASEYGVQSLPQFQTLSTVSVKEDWSFFSPLLLHRQHHENGNKQMLDQIQMHFNLPNTTNSLGNFKYLLYLTQVSQAVCIKAESEHYRRLQSIMDKGRGKTMGAIYWQLNSIWPAPTWSSLEYGGTWKMLHYYAKDFFAPVTISSFEMNNTLYVFGVSDRLEAVTLQLKITVWSWQDLKPLTTLKKKVLIASQSSVKLYQDDIDEFLNSSSCKDRTKCVATLSMVGNNDENETPINVHYFSPLKNVRLLNPQLKIDQIVSKKEQEFLIGLKAQAVAPFVWLTSSKIPGRFSSNGFLVTESLTQVSFYAWTSVTVDELKESLTISSLHDVYMSNGMSQSNKI